jgi:lipoyl(octanoyl) transferase
LNVAWLGRIDHADAVARMESIRARVLAGDAGAQQLLLCEHPPTITLGKSADRTHVVAPAEVLAARGVTLSEASRGGDVTYHGPGQLMIYPVVRVRRGVVAFLESIAGVIAGVARELGVDGAAWQREPAGVWLDGMKLAACGLHLRRQVAIHGWALDVATPPEMWQLIVPCGLATPVISLDRARRARGLASAPDVADIASMIGPRLRSLWSQ